MLAVAITCAVLGFANALAAMFYGWHGQWISLFFSMNFLVLCGMVQLRAFG